MGEDSCERRVDFSEIVLFLFSFFFSLRTFGPNDADGSHFEARGPSFAASSSWCGRTWRRGRRRGRTYGSLGRRTNSSRRTRGLCEVAAGPRTTAWRERPSYLEHRGPLESFLLNGWPNTIVYALLAVHAGVLCTRVLSLSCGTDTLYPRHVTTGTIFFFFSLRLLAVQCYSPRAACSQTLNPATRGDNAS